MGSPRTTTPAAGSVALSNPTIEQIEIDGSEAILVTLYVLIEGARGEEDGPLIFYWTLQPGLVPR